MVCFGNRTRKRIAVLDMYSHSIHQRCSCKSGLFSNQNFRIQKSIFKSCKSITVSVMPILGILLNYRFIWSLFAIWGWRVQPNMPFIVLIDCIRYSVAIEFQVVISKSIVVLRSSIPTKIEKLAPDLLLSRRFNGFYQFCLSAASFSLFPAQTAIDGWDCSRRMFCLISSLTELST